MLCLSCAEPAGRPLCRSCRFDLTPGPQVRLPSGLLVSSAYRHTGAARRLVHRLKYQGLTEAGSVLAEAIAGRAHPAITAVVPVPRALVRRVQHGIDPARALAELVAGRLGVPLVAALAPALWWPRHASRPRDARRRPRFRQRAPVPDGAALVDDVVTSGATLDAAMAAIEGDLWQGLTATSPGRVIHGGAHGASRSREDEWRPDRRWNRVSSRSAVLADLPRALDP